MGVEVAEAGAVEEAAVAVAVVVVDDDSDDEGFTVTAEWVLLSVLVLELVMELMRLPASFLVMVAGA
jgi:hypothetical protein